MYMIRILMCIYIYISNTRHNCADRSYRGKHESRVQPIRPICTLFSSVTSAAERPWFATAFLCGWIALQGRASCKATFGALSHVHLSYCATTEHSEQEANLPRSAVGVTMTWHRRAKSHCLSRCMYVTESPSRLLCLDAVAGTRQDTDCILGILVCPAKSPGITCHQLHLAAGKSQKNMPRRLRTTQQVGSIGLRVKAGWHVVAIPGTTLLHLIKCKKDVGALLQDSAIRL